MMEKIGVTQAGTVIVEMSQQEFEAMRLLLHSGPKKEATGETANGTPKIYPSKDDAVSGVSGDQMTLKQAVDYCAPRLVKLGPKKKDGVLKSLHAMFNFQGGVSDARTEEIYEALRGKGVFAETNGKISYDS